MEYAPNAMSVVDRNGRRKYLTENEMLRFIRAVDHQPVERRLFAWMLILSGGRISEVLSVRTDSFDLEGSYVIFFTLKQRRKRRKRTSLSQCMTFLGWLWPFKRPKPDSDLPPIYRFRPVPLPPAYIRSLDSVFNLLSDYHRDAKPRKLWPVNRKTAYRWVKEMMANAAIYGPHAHPHALRHTYGVNNSNDVTQATVLQRWMGHADIRTTQIYQQMWGEEELKCIHVMWRKLKIHDRRNFHL